MQPSTHRRNSRSERFPTRMSFELGEGADRESFEGDVLDFTRGGASMRSPYLPEIGARLSCRFRCGVQPTEVCVRAEVVWAQLDGGRSGEFGLAFVELDPEVEWLIEESLAAPIGRRELEPELESDPVTQLELEGSAEPISARLARLASGSAVFEQHLDLLSLGRGVRAHAPGARDRSGSIAGVELRMVGNVPMLAVTVNFEEEEAATAEPDLNVPHDTIADVLAPEWIASGTALDPEQAPSITLTEFRLNERAAARRGSPQRRGVAEPGEATQPVALREAPTEFAIESTEVHGESTVQVGTEGQAELPARMHALAQPLRAWFEALQSRCSERLAELRQRYEGLEQSLLADARELYHKQFGTRFGAVRRLVMRRRRATAGPGASNKRAPSGLTHSQLALCGAVGVAGLVLVVALLRGTGGREPAPVAEVETAAPAAIQAEPAVPEQAPAPALSLGSAELPLPGNALIRAHVARRSAAATADDTANAAEEGVPTSAPGVPAPTARPQATTRAAKPRFGAAQLPRAQRFQIRMSAPIAGLQGSARRDGFSVNIAGAQSLDPAAPLAKRFPQLIAKAKILNQSNGAVLDVSFAAGKQPQYQVSADESTLYIALQGK